MVTADSSFASEESMSLQSAIMMYTNSSGSAFGTAHNIGLDGNGAPYLLEGHPLTMKILNVLTAALAKGAESSRSFSGFLPATVLATGISSIVWWLQAADRTVSFSCNDDIIGKRSGKTPHPSLVFGVNEQGWFVFAVKGNKRPTPETALFQAPFFNVWETGKICIGTTRIPNGATAEQIDEWNKAFFASSFSHPNVHSVGGLVKSGGAYAFWRDLLDGKYKTFPQKQLVATKKTLNDFIKSTLNGETL